MQSDIGRTSGPDLRHFDTQWLSVSKRSRHSKLHRLATQHTHTYEIRSNYTILKANIHRLIKLTKTITSAQVLTVKIYMKYTNAWRVFI